MNISQIKLNEFHSRAYELSDEIFQEKIKSVTVSQLQLEFYGVELIQVMQTFLTFLEQLQGPAHPDDKQVIWKVYADKSVKGYKLKFIQTKCS